MMCLHPYISILFQLSIIYWFQTWIIFQRLFVPFTNTEQKTSNNVSEFMHSSWIMPSYYPSSKHKNLIPRDFIYTSLTSVHYNLKHGPVTVTESFSPLNLDYITSIIKV